MEVTNSYPSPQNDWLQELMMMMMIMHNYYACCSVIIKSGFLLSYCHYINHCHINNCGRYINHMPHASRTKSVHLLSVMNVEFKKGRLFLAS